MNNEKKCAICKVSSKDTELMYAHLTPGYMCEEKRGRDDLILVCRECYRMLKTGFKKIEFNEFLYQMIKKSNDYTTVLKEPVLGYPKRYRPDLFLSKFDSGKEYKYIIESKTNSAYSKVQSNIIIEYMLELNTYSNDSKMIFAFPSRMPQEAKQEFLDNGILVWDLDYISEKFGDEIKKLPFSFLKSYFLLFGYNNSKDKKDSLLDKLKNCKPGKLDCFVYQKLVGEILDTYFTPPLGKPISESSDSTKSNRRDFILSNYANDGFWRFLREKYNADYIVVDAKNSSKKVKKKDVIQIANYLKTYGAGMFAIIFSRNGGDSAGCYHTLREQWMSQGKMIIILDDYDVKSILSSSSKRAVEEVIGTKIEEFRLSM